MAVFWHEDLDTKYVGSISKHMLKLIWMNPLSHMCGISNRSEHSSQEIFQHTRLLSVDVSPFRKGWNKQPAISITEDFNISTWPCHHWNHAQATGFAMCLPIWQPHPEGAFRNFRAAGPSGKHKKTLSDLVDLLNVHEKQQEIWKDHESKVINTYQCICRIYSFPATMPRILAV